MPNAQTKHACRSAILHELREARALMLRVSETLTLEGLTSEDFRLIRSALGNAASGHMRNKKTFDVLLGIQVRHIDRAREVGR